jgi:hypothetical protein
VLDPWLEEQPLNRESRRSEAIRGRPRPQSRPTP